VRIGIEPVSRCPGKTGFSGSGVDLGLRIILMIYVECHVKLK
jgi:hypothetical protein